MAEETKAVQIESEPASAPAGEPTPSATDWKAEARKWEARAKANKAEADSRAKADEERQAALQAAIERAEKAESEKAKLEAEKERAAAVKAAAVAHGVDAETLARMGGDVEENAAFLEKRKREAAYPTVRDGGQVAASTVTVESIEAIKDPKARVMARAKNINLYR